MEKVQSPYPIIGALGGKAGLISKIGRLPIGPGQSLGNVAYLKDLQMTLVSEPRLMDSTPEGVIIIKDKLQAKVYRPQDVTITENNPPKLVFPRKGAFWARNVDYAGQRPEEQFAGPDIQPRNLPGGARPHSSDDSDTDVAEEEEDEGEAEYDFSSSTSSAVSGGAGSSRRKRSNSEKTIPKKTGRRPYGGRHF
jgi:hypothetical protein